MANFEYYGLFLTDKGKEKVNELLPSIDSEKALEYADKLFIDHCTLLHRFQVAKDIKKANKIIAFMDKNDGVIFNITIIGYGKSDKAMALRIDPHDNVINTIGCMNDKPHITIATFNGGKAKDSNDIMVWYNLKEPIKVQVYLGKR